jgi:polyhydroxybutyrate depolymerase
MVERRSSWSCAMRWKLEWIMCAAISIAALAACSSKKSDDNTTATGTGGIGAGSGGVPATGTGGIGTGSGGSPGMTSGSGGMLGTGSGGATGTGGMMSAGDEMDGGSGDDMSDAAAPSDGGSTETVKCTAPMLAAGDHMMMLDHDGEQREYNVHVPTKYDGTKAVPLVLDFHGWTSSAMAEEGASGWKEKADEIGFITVYPLGLDQSWNGGALCCGTSQSSGVDDQGFAIAIVDKMKEDACIDPKRVYVTGISNGGAMSHLLACKESDVFAAAAPVSMGNGTTPCMPGRPISVVMFRGEMDELVAYNGGTFPSAMADFDMWKDINGCTGSPMMTHTYCETYTDCMAGTEVTLCSLPNGMHNVYQDSAEVKVADVAWEAFERQILP